MMAVSLCAVWFLFYDRHMEYDLLYVSVMMFLFAVLYYSFGKLYDAFHISYSRISEMTYSQSLSALVTDALMWLIFCLLLRRIVNPLPMFLCWGGQIIASTIWSRLTHGWYFRTYPPKRTALIYESKEQMEELIESYGMKKKFGIEMILKAEECVKDIEQLKEMQAVFINRIGGHNRNVIIKYCLYNDISVFVIPKVDDIILSGAHKMHLFHLPMLLVEKNGPSMFFLFFKRLFDIVASLAVLIVLFPFMLIIAAAIKLYDEGPVFYLQDRVTKDNRVFKIIKFRSMKVDAEKEGEVILSTGDKDNRITPVGRIIRKLRIDELPQLINIIKGDMSIVGPRPERPELVEIYERDVPEFRLRTQVKAGLTGYAQVYGKYNTTPEHKLLMDLQYIYNRSLSEDMKIIFATIKILFLPESTEGFEPEEEKDK